MSDYDEQMRLWHEGKITAKPIRIGAQYDKDAQIAQLIRERDEARAKAFDEAVAVAKYWLGPDSYCEAALLALKDKP